MDKRPKKELIDGIRDSLRNFEETYDRSEWEHFQRQRKNKRRRPIPLFVKLTGIAASLFLIAYASVKYLPFFETRDDADKTIPKEASHPLKGKVPKYPDSLTVDSVAQIVDKKIRASVVAQMGQTREPWLGEVMPAERPVVRKELTPIEKAYPMADSIIIKRQLSTVPHPTLSLIAELGEARKPIRKRPGKVNRITSPKTRPLLGNGVNLGDIMVGVNITPALTNKGFAFGGGASAQIPLSNRFSTEVGVSYMNLKVGADMEADKRDTISMQTVGVRNSVGMIALPITLNYAISENFSASLGLVPFRVISDQRTDILQSYRWVIGNELSGDTTRRLVGERTRTKRTDSLYMGNTYLGFIEVSARYTPPLLKKRNMVLSPFIAIPLGRLRDDEYRWLHGGVSIRFYLR